MIKAPYNFVPLSEKVVFPNEWSSLISQDVPFSDGISGSVTVRFTAETPIFIRNGHTRKDAETNYKAYASFSNVVSSDNKTHYFIPGTSVKGAIRNILEIMTFGKMNVDQNLRFAQRDWDNKQLYTLKEPKIQQKIRCGWLKKIDDDTYQIIDCGIPERIAQTEIDYYLNSKIFENNFSKPNVAGKLPDEHKTAAFKYSLVESLDSLKILQDLKFGRINNDDDSDQASKGLFVAESGNLIGTIVLTGQPNLWNSHILKHRGMGAGKFYEFVFRTPAKNCKTYNISKEEFEQYKLMYQDSEDWKFANKKFLNDKGIPVFFRIEDDRLIDWGLAFLYKMPYKRTPHQALPDDHKSDRPDMAECIFGYSDNKSSLKGRVQFTPFRSENAYPDKDYKLALCGPKASYYPIYIEQRGDSGILQGNQNTNPYKTLNDGRLKGWKRYLLRERTWENATSLEKIDTIINPLRAGTIFEGKINFHNLRPVELGALLSALTFFGNEEKARHQLGMAKPYGFGKVKIEIKNVELISVGETDRQPEKDRRVYMELFKNYMNLKLGKAWALTPEIKELLTIVENPVSNNYVFDYMKLDMKGRNEFLEAKGGRGMNGTRRFLPYYSELISKQGKDFNRSNEYNRSQDYKLSNDLNRNKDNNRKNSKYKRR